MSTIRTISAGLSLLIIVLSSGFAQADPFVNPPELNHPDWVTPFPYQRNILVGYDTDPHQWPDHVTSPAPDERKALTPDVVHHEGMDDPVLYPSDWLAEDVQPPSAGFTDWLADDTITGTPRQGILVMDGQADSQFTLIWHIDNWDWPREEKHFYAEAEYYTTGNLGIDQLLSSTGQIEVLTADYENLADGWIRWRGWATLVPNPEWEEMINVVTFEDPGIVLMDYMHIATECVPEPTTLALLVLGLTMCLRRR